MDLAVASVVTRPALLATLASLTNLLYAVIARAARMIMSVTTTINSVIVKPRWDENQDFGGGTRRPVRGLPIRNHISIIGHNRSPSVSDRYCPRRRSYRQRCQG